MIKIWMLIYVTSYGSGNIAHISHFETKEECEKKKIELIETGVV